MPPPAAHSVDLFASYAREDAAPVIKVQHELQALGISMWIDRDEISAGDKFAEKLDVGLSEARCVLVFYSRHAAESEWVHKEWNVALKQNKRIIPVRLDDSELPEPMQKLDFVDFAKPERLDTAVIAIARAVHIDYHISAPTNSSVLGSEVAIL